MMLSFQDWLYIKERMKFAHATSTGTAQNILSSDIAEERMQIPIGFIASDTSGATNTFDISKVEEGNTTTLIHQNFNIAGNETIWEIFTDIGMMLPTLEGGANLEINANAGNVEFTLIHVSNIEV